VNTPFRSSAARTAATIAAAAALFLSGGIALTGSTAADHTGGGWTATGPTGSHARFVDKHGPVLHRPQLYLIYWGSGWQPQASPDPTPAQVTAAARTILTSSYLDGLAQYRGIGRGQVRGSTVITTSDPPVDFTGDQIAEFVDAQLTAGTVPEPDPDNQTIYGVVLPTGVGPGWTGKHNYYTRAGQRIRYAWFTNGGDLNWITRTISHELVESATDPEGTGIVGVPGCDEPGWCEICLPCMSALAEIDGVAVQGYWSNRDGACIIPGSGAPTTTPGRPRRPSTQRAPGLPGWEAT